MAEENVTAVETTETAVETKIEPTKAETTKKEKKEKKPKKTGKIVGIVILGILLLAAGIGAGAWYALQLDEKEKAQEMMAQEGIYPGISIAGIDVSGMSPDKALLLLENDSVVNGELCTIALTWEDESWVYTLGELGVTASIEEAVDGAYQYGRGADAEENLANVQALLHTGLDFAVGYEFDSQVVADILDELQEDIDQEMVEAAMVRERGETRAEDAFVVTEDQVGRSLDVSATNNAVVSIVEAMLSGNSTGTGSVALVVDVEEPTLTAEIFEESQDLIGTYYTTYTFTDVNRNTNLEVGCAYITDTILMPDEELSLNEGLGEQTAERGYKDAGVYENGKVVSGMGGGVCQITTTVYNAAIFAEIEIVKRYAHSMPVGYVPLGRDAAVAGTYKDLVIKNDTEYPIYLEAFAEDGVLQVNLYGHEIHEEGRTLEYKTVWEQTVAKPAEIITEDPERYEGEREITYQGQTGSVIAVYKLVYQDEELVSEELFNKSSYISVADEVTVGTKPLETTPVYVPSYEELWGTTTIIEEVEEAEVEESIEEVVE